MSKKKPCYVKVSLQLDFASVYDCLKDRAVVKISLSPVFATSRKTFQDEIQINCWFFSFNRR